MFHTLKKLTWVGCLLSLAACAAPPSSAGNDLETIRKLAQERLSKTSDDSTAIKTIRQSAYPGLYELVTENHKVVYTDSTASFLFVGHLYDLKTARDLTAERIDEVTAIKFDSLPLELAIKQVKGNGKRRIAVFSDTDCPFCRKLETELAGITDVTVYTFLYPIQQLHPSAPEHSRRIWCAADRQKAWSEYWSHNAIPDARECDVTGLDKILKLGASHDIQATPTLVFGDGHVIPGALPMAQLERGLNAR